MQVFVPYGAPLLCAEILDARRLNKQIIECRQILAAIRGESSAWKNHPVVKMYRDHAKWLEYYMHCLECYKSYQDLYDTDLDDALHDLELAREWNRVANDTHPLFFDSDFYDQHRRRLYTKSPKDYARFELCGTSDVNWYFVDGEWLHYRNGKVIKD